MSTRDVRVHVDVTFGPTPVTIDDVAAIAAGAVGVALSTDAAFRARIDASRASLERQLAAGRTIYGVTTGVGESCETVVPLPRTGEVSANLLRFHGCGTGAPLTDEESAPSCSSASPICCVTASCRASRRRARWARAAI